MITAFQDKFYLGLNLYFQGDGLVPYFNNGIIEYDTKTYRIEVALKYLEGMFDFDKYPFSLFLGYFYQINQLSSFDSEYRFLFEGNKYINQNYYLYLNLTTLFMRYAGQ